MIRSLPEDLIVLSVSDVAAAFHEGGAEWLATEEEIERRSLSIQKRHDEWLAGRVAAKRAVQRATGLPFCRLVIRRSTHPEFRGRPEVYLDGQAGALGHLSISHSSGHAAACFGDRPVGIDLERVFSPEPAFAETAFSAKERARFEDLSGSARDEASTLAWCAKEAYAKWLGRGFALALHELDPSRDDRVRLEHGRLPQAPEVIWARAQSSAKMYG